LITTGNVVTFEDWLPTRLMEPTVPYTVPAPEDPEAAVPAPKDAAGDAPTEDVELPPGVITAWSPSAICPIWVSSTEVLTT
jgi:hypothetical protein